MHTVHTNLLKKFTLEEIEQMREMARKEIPREIIAKTFNCAITTVSWHTGDLIKEYPDSVIIY